MGEREWEAKWGSNRVREKIEIYRWDIKRLWDRKRERGGGAREIEQKRGERVRNKRNEIHIERGER